MSGKVSVVAPQRAGSVDTTVPCEMTSERPESSVGGGQTQDSDAVPVAAKPSLITVEDTGIVLRKFSETKIRLSSKSKTDLVLEPGFVARRWSEAAAMPEVAATFADARRMRERVV